jgi:FGGY-family pentulose kinase
MSSERYVIGIDVGTGSARAGIFDARGKMLASASEPIEMWKPKPDYAEQSSGDIWRAICKVVRACREESGVAAEAVAGISYDATCSLVALDTMGQPLAVNDEGDNNRNIIVWMDHRALAETEEINAGKHEVLKYVGGRLSPEMETPKLRWLKTHLPQTWERAGKFFDLADFLTYCSTGLDARSLCTVVCKWTYLGHEGKSGKWDKKYFKKIGLSDLFEGDKIGSDMRPMGSKLGPLTLQSAAELGLTTNCVVGVGIIDAHAGGLGLLGAVWSGQEKIELQRLESALALIGGTSNCHMAVSREPRFIEGVWGPYWSAMVPGMWLTEGGQSTAGSAIDHVINDHAHAGALSARAKKEKKTVYELLNMEIARLQAVSGMRVLRVRRSPKMFMCCRISWAIVHHTPTRTRTGIVDGLSLDESITSQALLYYATIQAVAYGTRDIIAAMNDTGYNIDTMFVTGGGTKNPLWLQETADATGTTLVLPQEPEAVLLGSAVLAATAAGLHPDIYRAMQNMSHAGKTVKPRKETAAYHKAKFKVFREMYKEQKRRRSAMEKF